MYFHHSAKIGRLGLFGLTRRLITMKKILRDRPSKAYYDEQWRRIGAEEDSFENLDIYPIKYAEIALSHAPADALILENGCGIGRVLTHYHKAGRKIIGMEFNEFALFEIRKRHPDIPLVRADARHMPFKDGVFDVVLAYGLYHNIEENLNKGIRESRRIMKHDGVICASGRICNIQYLAFEIKHWLKNGGPKSPVFYKWVFKKKEWIDLFTRENFSPLDIQPAYSTHPLYRLSVFRDPRCFGMSEDKLRSYGRRLNPLGRFLDKCFHRLYDWLVCDRIVFIGRLKLFSDNADRT